MTTGVITADLKAVEPVASAVSIGFFDGVHRGHQQIIGQASAHARAHDLRSVVVTFDRHPLQIIRPQSAPPLLMTSARRATTLAALGVDLVVVLAFDERLRQLDAEDFIAQVLRSSLNTRHLVVGQNFRFGHRAAGDIGLLERVGARDGFTVDGVPLFTLAGEPISSTRIRAALAAGDVAAAARLLGRPHVIDGEVVHGDHRGRALGYATANLAFDPHCVIPAPGVYAGVLTVPGRAGERALPAVTSIGTNPTFNGSTLRVESHVLDFDEDLYGQQVAVDLRRHLRGQERFPTVEALIAAMDTDVRAARAALG